MELFFSTEINGKPTHFVEKIWKGLKTLSPEAYIKVWASVSPKEMTKKYQVDMDVYKTVEPKLHTIRQDKRQRWKIGVPIDFSISTKTKDMFCFAPRIPVISIQSIVISDSNNGFKVSIDGRQLDNNEIQKLAINDGFEDIFDFQNYFNERLKNCFFIGKIIHWTFLKY